jgi:glycosyltransferase involved in cell wall biosynthesis
MNSNPVVSIIVPCYNQGKFLQQALESISAQTFTNWECIIVNDGSTDTETELIGQKFSKDDDRFSYIEQANSGVSAARNAALDICKGKYIRFLDADDWFNSQALELSVEHTGDHTLVLNQLELFIEESQEIVPYYYKLKAADLTFDNILLNFGENFDIPIHCATIPARMIQGFRFNTQLHIGEDWVMWLHIFRQVPIVFVVERPLVWYRKWPDSATFQINKSLKYQFLTIQHIIRYFDVDEHKASKLNRRIIDKLIYKIEALEQSNEYIRNSTSFKIGHFIVKSLSFFKPSRSKTN